MGLSIVIARVISVIYIATGIGVLIGTVRFMDIVNELKSSPVLRFMAATVGMIRGMILVTYHNIWVKNWTVLMTLISWAMLAGGVLVVLIPKSISWGKGFIKNPRLLGTFMVLFGLLMGYFGFIK